MPTIEKEKEFGIELIRFYKEFLLGTAKSVVLLSEIEKKFPENYAVLKQLKDDPQAIYDITTKMPSEVKDALILIVVKASAIGRKMNALFDLSQAQKEELAKEIVAFSAEVEKKLGGLK